VLSTEARRMVSVPCLKYVSLTEFLGTDDKQYVIKKFIFERDSKYAKEGVHAKNWTFNLRNRQKNTEEQITVFDYFRRTYNMNIEHWYLPLIETDRAGVFPMEVCTLVPNQKYQYKLSPDQVRLNLVLPKFTNVFPRLLP
jgi:hypothetical protein